jgi:tRNA-guanine family transglycosylase
MHMTHRWLKRCLTHLDKTPLKYDYNQTFFPIVQGSTYKDLRRRKPDLSKAKDLLGYSPSIPLKEAIHMVVNKMREGHSNK